MSVSVNTILSLNHVAVANVHRLLSTLLHVRGFVCHQILGVAMFIFDVSLCSSIQKVETTAQLQVSVDLLLV